MAIVNKKENEEVVFGLEWEDRVGGHYREPLCALMKQKINMQIPVLYPLFYIFTIKSLYFTWVRDFVMHFKIKL